MARAIFIFTFGVLLGGICVSLVYSQYVREVQLKNHILLYSKKAQDLLVLKESPIGEEVCLNYILTKGDIDVLRSIEPRVPSYFFSDESKQVIENHKSIIAAFDAFKPEKYGCKNI